MFIDITERNFNTTKEIWENNGMKTYDVPLSTADCRIEEKDAVITLRLPHEDALYTDYASIMYWLQGDDGTEKEESRAGLSVPSSCRMTVVIGDDDVSSQFTSTVSGGTKGLAELRIHCENVQALEALISAPKAITYLRPMWYTGYGEDNALNPDRLTPENTVVMEDMRDALECRSLTEGRGQILNGKKYLFTFEYPATDPDDTPNEKVFNWTNADGISLSPSYYEIIHKDGTEDFTDDPNVTGSLQYDGKLIYTTSGCIYVKMKRMNYHFENDVGYNIEQIDDVLSKRISPADCTDVLRQRFNMFNTDEMININLRRSGLYLVSGTLSFEKSNICIIGHGSQIRVWEPKVTKKDDYYILFGNSNNTGVKNIEMCDLKLSGLTKYENGNIVNGQEKCLRFQGYTESLHFPVNMTVYNVAIDGFDFAVHTNAGIVSKNRPLDHRFINCNVSRTMFGYHFKACSKILVSGGSIDNSLSTDKIHHCVYVALGSNNIIFENCLLENSTGAAIHQMDSDNNNKMHDNLYRNLTINNCFDGIVVGGFSRDTKVEHIRGENIGNFVYLGNCRQISIDDYKATQLPSATIRVGTGSEAHEFRHTNHYSLFIIAQCVDALITNSVFGGDDVNFSNNYECPEFMSSADVKHTLDPSAYDEGCVEDGFAIADLTFMNCVFSHKNINCNKIGTKSSFYHAFNMLFINCTFKVCRPSIIKVAAYIPGGNPNCRSSFVLMNCKGYYKVENVNDTLDFACFFNKDLNEDNCDFYVRGSFDAETSWDTGGEVNAIGGAIYL